MSSEAAVSGKATVTLEVKLETASNDLVEISYTVHNLRSGKIYVFNTLFHTDERGNRTPDPELAWVVASANHNITVGKFLIPIPPGMKVESVDMPYLDPVGPGQVLAGKISLRWPLHTFDPYHPDSETKLELAGAKLLVQIGFIDPSRGAPKEALIQPAKGAGAGHFQCDYGLGVKYQEILQQPVALPATAR